MLPIRAVRPFGSSMLAATALLTFLATPAAAQDPRPESRGIHDHGRYDFTNAYLFRGIKQETEGLIMYHARPAPPVRSSGRPARRHLREARRWSRRRQQASSPWRSPPRSRSRCWSWAARPPSRALPPSGVTTVAADDMRERQPAIVAQTVENVAGISTDLRGPRRGARRARAGQRTHAHPHRRCARHRRAARRPQRDLRRPGVAGSVEISRGPGRRRLRIGCLRRRDPAPDPGGGAGVRLGRQHSSERWARARPSSAWPAS